jgi:hypothetical protein
MLVVWLIIKLGVCLKKSYTTLLQSQGCERILFISVLTHVAASCKV